MKNIERRSFLSDLPCFIHSWLSTSNSGLD